MNRIVLATQNRDKLTEFRSLLSPFQVEILPMPADLTVVEDGETYLENSMKKAAAVARTTGIPALADDSGIEVEALDGAPGIQSARFLNGASDEEKCAKILELLHGRTRRAARYAIALVLCDIRRPLFAANAEVCGEIALQPRGTGGFGYDPIFVPEDYKRTMAELSPAEKNKLSHRGRAVRAFLRFLAYSRS